MTDREALAAELVSDSAVARERRYHLLHSATAIHVSLGGGRGDDRWLASYDSIPACVDRAESLLAEIEKREREAAQCEATGNSKGEK